MTGASWLDAHHGLRVVGGARGVLARREPGRAPPRTRAYAAWGLTAGELAALVAAARADGVPPATWLERAVYRVLGLDVPAPAMAGGARGSLAGRRLAGASHAKGYARALAFHLADAARAPLLAAADGRALSAWFRDAARAALGRRFRWTMAADGVLRRLFRRADAAAVARALPGASPAALRSRAKHLGLCLARPEGLLNVGEAAAFAGVSREAVVRWIARGMLPTTSLAGAQAPRRRGHAYVRRADVRALATAESLRAAARRLGVAWETLRAALGDRWAPGARLAPEVYTAALAARRVAA